MLTMLREAARTWIAKVLFFLLVASFAVWGVSGSMFQGAGDSVVTVGETEVSATEFRLAYDRQISQLSQQFGTRLTREQARAFGIENQVYSQLVAGAALDQQARDMGLGISESRLANLIAEDPAFQGINGQFSRDNFAAVLRNVGMSEDDYIDSRSEVARRTQVVEALADGFTLPETLLDAVATHRAEARTLSYIRITEDMIDPIGEPDDETLAAYFEENQSRYRRPEYRSVAYVELTAEGIADPGAISDEQVRADYEANASRYETPERRTLDQLVFPDREAAEEAADRLADGETFDDLVAETGRTMDDVRIGTFSREEMSNEALAEAAFSIEEEGGVSDVADGPFGPVILRASEIEEGGTDDFDEIADTIREELALIEASDLLFDVYNAYEDARAGGMSLEEAAREQRLEPRTIEAIDSQGRDTDGNPVENVPEAGELIPAVFESDIGIDAQPISIGTDGYVFFEVLDIEDARDRELDEVRDEVVADWQADQTDEALETLAQDLATRLEEGEELSAIAEELGTEVSTEYGLQREGDDAVFGNAAIAAAFNGPRGHVAVAPTGDDNGHILMRVDDIATSLSAGLGEDERAAIAESGAGDLLDQLVVRLQSQYPVSINQQLGEQALSY